MTEARVVPFPAITRPVIYYVGKRLDVPKQANDMNYAVTPMRTVVGSPVRGRFRAWRRTVAGPSEVERQVTTTVLGTGRSDDKCRRTESRGNLREKQINAREPKKTKKLTVC